MRLTLFWLTPAILLAQGSPGFHDTLRKIFDDPKFRSKTFGPARWIEGGRAYATVENSAKEIASYDTATGKRELLLPSQERAIAGYEFSSDRSRVLIFTNTRKVWRMNTRGDYWLIDRNTGKARQIGGRAPESSLMFAKLSPDGSHVAYVRGNNIYVEPAEGGPVRALTSDGSETTINGTSYWVYEEEFRVRDGFRWSPDSQSIAYFQFDSSGVDRFALINNTDNLYPGVSWIRYPKAGTRNSHVRIGVVSRAGGATKWMKASGDPWDSYIARMEWASNSNELVLQQLNRLQNRNDVLLADTRSGEVRRLIREEDAAWVDVEAGINWLKDGKEFLWKSERDGWARYYVVSRDGSNARGITPPKSDATAMAAIDHAGGWLYYIAAPENATQRYLYRAPLQGNGRAERVTPRSMPGSHTYQIAPNGLWAFHTYSSMDRPPFTELVRLPSHETVRVLEENSEYRAQAALMIRRPAEFTRIAIGDGVALDAWMIKPSSFDPSKSYPLLVYVYGEPAGVTVTDNWSQRELFHRAIAEEGYIVASFDNRGTPAPKGRDWRKSIYGEVGVLSTQDQTAAVRALAAKHSFIDAARVAVWGWSGGGSNTLNLMFRSPDVFKVGISVAPVPDQRLYDTIYQERYMGLPADNAKGYEAGSPIHHAAGLRGKLLIVHGTGDDNVHYQGLEKLANKLIELGKPFDMMAYPNRSHSISEGKGTSLHVHSLIARYLMQHLPPASN